MFFNRSAELKGPPMASKGSATSAEWDISRHIRSANQRQLIVPRYRRITFGPNPAEVATALPQTPLPAVSLRPRILALRTSPVPQDKFLAASMGSSSNQNCCKEFRFKEKIENTDVRYSHRPLLKNGNLGCGSFRAQCRCIKGLKVVKFCF